MPVITEFEPVHCITLAPKNGSNNASHMYRELNYKRHIGSFSCYTFVHCEAKSTNLTLCFTLSDQRLYLVLLFMDFMTLSIGYTFYR